MPLALEREGADRSGLTRPLSTLALFEPEQQTKLQEDITRREGRILFAGEHSSLHHAWIQGALESGIRAAREIHEAAEAMSPQASSAGGA